MLTGRRFFKFWIQVLSLKKSASRKKSKYAIPTQKISETLIEFGAPVLQELPEDATKEVLEGAFRLIVCAWNAVVLDQWNNTGKHEKDFLNAIGPVPMEFGDIPKGLIKRKKLEYSTDLRAVGDHWLLEKNGEIVFRAEARLDFEKAEAVVANSDCNSQ